MPWVEGGLEVGPPRDVLVLTGLQYLHGLDMTVDLASPHFVSHGGGDRYVLSDTEVAARLDHWLRLCDEYDEDPEGFIRRARERARRTR